jgi:hypothetical protein
MAARKGTTGSKSRRKPSNSRPRKVRHGATGRSKSDIQATIERAESDAPGFQRKPSWGAYGYLVALMGRVTKSSFAGFAPPTNASEADVQIRSMAGVSATATRAASEKQVAKVLSGKAAAKSPVGDAAKLREIAATRAVAELDS